MTSRPYGLISLVSVWDLVRFHVAVVVYLLLVPLVEPAVGQSVSPGQSALAVSHAEFSGGTPGSVSSSSLLSESSGRLELRLVELQAMVSQLLAQQDRLRSEADAREHRLILALRQQRREFAFQFQAFQLPSPSTALLPASGLSTALPAVDLTGFLDHRVDAALFSFWAGLGLAVLLCLFALAVAVLVLTRSSVSYWSRTSRPPGSGSDGTRLPGQPSAPSHDRPGPPDASPAPYFLSLALSGWTYASLTRDVPATLDPAERGRRERWLRRFQRELAQSVSDAHLKFVDLTGQPFDPGMAVSVLNPGELENESHAVVERMLEPVVLSADGSVIHRGTVVLAPFAPEVSR